MIRWQQLNDITCRLVFHLSVSPSLRRAA